MAELRALADLADPIEAGGKGASLAWLQAKGYRIPDTLVALPGVAPTPASLPGEGPYAVRSSANVEDGAAASYAGQFLSVLDVTGRDAVAVAIQAVRDSATDEGVIAYSKRIGTESPIRMSVLIQNMVRPVVSGVVFTRNPTTGLNETIIEAVAGRGDRLVGDGLTPQRWVWRWGDWLSHPDDAVLPQPAAAALVAEAAAIAQDYGRPSDLEFVWDGSQVWWLQLRPITGIGDVAVYSNRISREVMPGLIKPLVWSVNVPVVNRAWIRLFSEAIGPNSLEPHGLAKAFAYRAYFNMGAIGDIFELLGMPRDSLEILLGLPGGPDKPRFTPSAATMRRLPRLVTFALRKSRYGMDLDKLLGELRSGYRAYERDLDAVPDSRLLREVDELMALGSGAAYANIVVPLLANLYRGLLDRRLAERGIDPTTVEIRNDAAATDLDPNPGLDRLAAVVAESGTDSPAATAALGDFLERFGHFSDSGNDFSVAPWREQPDLVMQMAAARGVAPPTAARRKWAEVTAQLGPLSRLTLGLLRRRAAEYQLRRDQVSSFYTYGYGLFRRYFLELGRRLQQRGVLEQPDDIMYLSIDEVRAAVGGGLSGAEAQARVTGHRKELERVANLPMPEVIFGDDYIAPPAAAPEATLRGVGTSRGHHRGRIRVVNGLADFAKVGAGDVLAIPFSDVGWTPLFAKAGAVIAESGGMLSHSSIVAREYGIPCVVSVAGVTNLADGTIVTVDGYRGEVVLG